MRAALTLFAFGQLAVGLPVVGRNHINFTIRRYSYLNQAGGTADQATRVTSNFLTGHR
jgi:hypothetical protein